MQRSRIRKSAVALAAMGLGLAAPAGATAAPMDFGGADDSLATVAFSTFEQMVPADVDDRLDVYERSGGVTRLVSTGTTGGNGPFSTTFNGISANGTRIAFSTAERLTADDTDSRMDIYYSEGGQLFRATDGGAPFPGNGNFDASFRALDRSTGRIAFETDEPLATADTDAAQDVYVRGAALARVSAPPTQNPQGTGNGAVDATFAGFGGAGRVFFHTNEALSTADTDAVQDVYMWDASGDERFVSDGDVVDAALPATFVGVGNSGDLPVWDTFEQAVDAEDDDDDLDVYSRDISAGVTKNESVAFTTQDVDIDRVALTSDRIFVHSSEQEAGDADAFSDVFQLRDGVATRISLSDGAADAFFGGTNADGTHVAWTTAEQVPGSGDTDTATDVYETVTAAVTPVSDGPGGNASAGFRAYAADGSRIVFSSAGNIGADQDGGEDLFVRTGAALTALTAGTGSGFLAFDAASSDGASVVFTTLDSVLPQDGDAEADIYKNLNGVTTLESFEVVAPVASITSGPTGVTKFNPPPFAFTANEANVSFSCRYDGAPFGACGSLAKLSQGPHTFEVRATDRAGNVGPAAARSFVVDSLGPKVTIKPTTSRPTFNGRFRVRVSCPRIESGSCKGKIVITSGSRVKVGNKRRIVTFASKSFSLKPGKSVTLTLRVSKKNLAILKRLRKVRVVMTATVRDGLGNRRTTRVGLTLRAPRANR